MSVTRTPQNGDRASATDPEGAEDGAEYVAVSSPWARDGRGVLAALEATASHGLTESEASRRLAAVGPNDLRLDRDLPLWRSVLAQLRETMILVLLGALALTLVTGDLADAAVIGLVVAVNTTVGVVQERRAVRAVAALRSLTAPTARVRRDGEVRSVPAAALVPGDVLIVRDGDLVAADARLLTAHALEADEAVLTGESVPSAKDAGRVVPEDAPVGDRVTMLHAGTTVVRGRGEAVVVATGAGSQVGVVAELLAGGSAPVTPLQRRLRRLGRDLSLVTVAACVLVAVLGLLRGQDWETVILTAISLAVAAIPESLPAVVALALAGGARRMARRGAIVRSLPAVETLGSVTLLATDKTGTLTRGAMECVALWTPRSGEVLIDGKPSRDRGMGPGKHRELGELLEAAVLCNDAPDSAASGPAGGTEAALVRAASTTGVDVAGTRRAWPRLREVPFDAVRRDMRTWHRDGGSVMEIVKGAPEVVLAELSASGSPRALDDAAKAVAVAETWASEGRRVLAVASRRGEDPLRLHGLIALADPLRPEARNAVLACRRAGIVPVLVTGDHPGTARAVAAATGITDAGLVDGTDEHVIARVDPAGKLALVQRWQAEGQVVAMTGDGVNDGPALRAADVGVAMGIRGTDVAKQAADIVLTDDSLATIVAAVVEGRRVFDNIRRFVRYGVSGGLAEVAVMLLGPLFGFGLPLLAGQILWINLLTHGLPGVAMGAEAAEADVGRRPPRPPREPIVTRPLAAEIAVLAAAMTAASLALAAWGAAAGRPWQSMLFAGLALAQLGVAVSTRSALQPLWRLRWSTNPMLGYAVALSALLTLAGLYLPPLAELLHTRPLSGAELGAALLAAAVPTVAFELLKAWRRRSTTSAGGPAPGPVEGEWNEQDTSGPRLLGPQPLRSLLARTAAWVRRSRPSLASRLDT
jgi:Ca2+-transporting ATPase